MENAAATATPVPGHGRPMTLSSGTLLTLRADASQVARTVALIPTLLHLATTSMAILAPISLMGNAVPTAALANGLGPPTILSNGAQRKPHADVRLKAQTTLEATVEMVVTMARMATRQTQMTQLIDIPGVATASQTQTMIAKM